MTHSGEKSSGKGVLGSRRCHSHDSWTDENMKFLGNNTLFVFHSWGIDVYECYSIDASFKNKKGVVRLISTTVFHHCAIFYPTEKNGIPYFAPNYSPEPFTLKVKETLGWEIQGGWLIHDDLVKGIEYADSVQDILDHYLNK
jgi:hypothetical protein